ncbi:MAG: class I SAM-dependent methyltransferase [Candidatus Woesearchaeota archaeon]
MQRMKRNLNNFYFLKMFDFKSDGLESQYPIPLILSNLGIVPSILDGRVLDIGCGKDARLVYFLKRYGIFAEGIDPEVNKDTSFLMKANAESIPRPDCTYDRVFSHYAHFKDGMDANREVVIRLIGEDRFQITQGQYVKTMIDTTEEAIRVLKPGKDFVIWPMPRYFIDMNWRYFDQNQIEVRHEKVKNSLFKVDHILLKIDLPLEEFYYRTVLTKPK